MYIFFAESIVDVWSICCSSSCSHTYAGEISVISLKLSSKVLFAHVDLSPSVVSVSGCRRHLCACSSFCLWSANTSHLHCELNFLGFPTLGSLT